MVQCLILIYLLLHRDLAMLRPGAGIAVPLHGGAGPFSLEDAGARGGLFAYRIARLSVRRHVPFLRARPHLLSVRAPTPAVPEECVPVKLPCF